ncbi:hypothetical protein OG430_06090 [Streptomyces sp. NBC_01304]|nr:hypothetical protein OG430_06090 [Streptomyces sp. NBC_01304]
MAGDELPEGPGERVPAVPRDLPDQQAHADDPLDVPEPEPPRTGGGREPDPELPDPDQPGAGPRGAPRKAGPHPEQPVPDEPSG